MEERLASIISFHGHFCPGIAVGYRASLLAMTKLGLSGNISNTHVAVIENEVCGIDAVQMITGCTVGNDGLIIENQGKQAYSLISKKDGKGVRVLLTADLWNHEEPLTLHRLVKLGRASTEEKARFFALREQRARELIAFTDEELFAVTPVTREIASGVRLFPTHSCSHCQEKVMEPYLKISHGQFLCPSCYKLLN